MSTHFEGVGALRTVIMNPLTTPDDLTELLETIRETGETLLHP